MMLGSRATKPVFRSETGLMSWGDTLVPPVCGPMTVWLGVGRIGFWEQPASRSAEPARARESFFRAMFMEGLVRGTWRDLLGADFYRRQGFYSDFLCSIRPISRA